MTTPRKPRKGKPKPTGPKPEVLKIEGDWKDAVSHALKRGKPPAGNDKPTKSKKSKKKNRK